LQERATDKAMLQQQLAAIEEQLQKNGKYLVSTVPAGAAANGASVKAMAAVALETKAPWQKAGMVLFGRWSKLVSDNRCYLGGVTLSHPQHLSEVALPGGLLYNSENDSRWQRHCCPYGFAAAQSQPDTLFFFHGAEQSRNCC
jgi:hypothetical protein